MVEMELSLMFDGAVEGGGRKLGAFFETAAKVAGFQGADEHGEERLASHSILFGRNWAVQVTD